MKADFWYRFFRNKMAVAGGAVVILLFVVSLFAPWISPYDPNAINLSEVLAQPSPDHPFGTAQLGRDVLSRIIWGAGISLKVGFVATGFSLLIGVILGALAGYYGRWVDAVIMRFVDIMLCFPSFFLILAVIAILEPSIWNIMIVIGLTGWMGITRLVRADFISLRERDFVQAARAVGAGHEALLRGVPVFCDSSAIYAPWANTDITELAEPEFTDTEDYFNRVGYAQWSMSEIADGTALEFELGETRNKSKSGGRGRSTGSKSKKKTEVKADDKKEG